MVCAVQASAASQDGIQQFIAAMGGVPPFTWLEQATRGDGVVRREAEPPSARHKAAEQANHASDTVKHMAHR